MPERHSINHKVTREEVKSFFISLIILGSVGTVLLFSAVSKPIGIIVCVIWVAIVLRAITRDWRH